ncbi:MAG: hypothetical protein Q9217_001603 [Psora testacea]
MTDIPTNDLDRQTSAVPALGEGFQENDHTPKAKATSDGGGATEVDTKMGKRRFWGLGKKKDDDKAKKKRESAVNSAELTNTPTQKSAMRPISPLTGVGNVHVLAKTTSGPYASPSSPARNLHSSTPAPPSPASSQIFERHVQEDSLAIREQAPVPGHITTENHIPPVLDASTEAITNDELDPDNVEIVMHSAHQPAAVTVTGTGSSEATGMSWSDDLVAHPDNEDAASNYGALDSADVRRLSFISFADVVHAEHADHSSSIATGMTSPVVPQNRSPSPGRSPLSSQGFSGSPIMSGSASSKGLETSPNRGGTGLGSPHPNHSPPGGGELTIETMRQALRKTGSGDLSGARSAPLSATGGDDGNIEHPFN